MASLSSTHKQLSAGLGSVSIKTKISISFDAYKLIKWLESEDFDKTYVDAVQAPTVKFLKGIIQSGTTNYAINSIFPDPTLAMSTTVINGAAGGAIGGFMWSSWTSNFKINFYTAKCLIGRGYILLDHEWWDKKAETRFSGIL